MCARALWVGFVLVVWLVPDEADEPRDPVDAVELAEARDRRDDREWLDLLLLDRTDPETLFESTWESCE